MAIEFHCVTCQKLLRVSDEAAGKKARCPDCGAIQDVASFPSAGAPRTPPVIPVPDSVLPPVGIHTPGESSPNSRPASVPPSANPFRDTPFQESGSTPTSINPYLAPVTQRGNTGFSSVLTESQARYAAERKVKPPAIALMILHSITLCIYIVVLAANIVQLVYAPQRADSVGNIAVSFVIMSISGFVLFCASQMFKMRRYGFAMTAAILSIIHCNPCCFLSFGFGLWALIVLMDPVVKRSFNA